MITLKDFVEAIEYKITEGSDYQWDCFGDNARYLDAHGPELNEDYSISAVFDSRDHIVYAIEAWDYKTNRELPKKNYYAKKYLIRWLEIVSRRKLAKCLLPLPHQKDVLDKIPDFYVSNDIGKLYWACGMGKALMSLLIAKNLGASKIVIGVPSIYLRSQMANEVVRVFPKAQLLMIGGRIEENDKRLFLSAFASLKSIFDRHSHHLLIYSNKLKNFSQSKFLNSLSNQERKPALVDRDD